MTTDINPNKLRIAIDWIGKLANGLNPLDGEKVEGVTKVWKVAVW